MLKGFSQDRQLELASSFLSINLSAATEKVFKVPNSVCVPARRWFCKVFELPRECCTASPTTSALHGLTQSCCLWLQNKNLFASERERGSCSCVLTHCSGTGCPGAGSVVDTSPQTETESGSALPVRARTLGQNDPFDSGAGNPLRVRSCVIIALIRLGQIQPV